MGQNSGGRGIEATGPSQQTRWKGESGTGSIHFPRPCTQKTWKGGDEWVHSVLEGKSETRPLFCAWLGSKRQGPAGAADTQPVASRGSPGRGPGSPGLRGRAAPRGQPVPGADARGLATVRRAAAVAEVHAAARQIGAPSPCPRLSPFFCAHKAPAPRGPQSAQRGSLRIAAFFYFLASFSLWSKK